MEFIVFLIVVTLVIFIIVQRVKNKKSQKEISRLKSEVQSLNKKTDFLYNCIKSAGAVPDFQQQNVPVPSPIVNDVAPPIQNQVEFPVEKPIEIPIDEIPVETPPAVAVSQTLPNTSPYDNVQPVVKKPAKTIQKRNIEEWLGARFFNIAASVLIFIGLILFCTLPTEQVSNTMKMIAMFIVSGGFIGVGSFMARKDRSIFPFGMLGCGFGVFFISILVSNVYFHSIHDIVAFGMILVWSAAALFMSKKLDSVMLSITAHIGTAISICFACSLSFTPEKALAIIVYQFVAIAVLIFGNVIFCQKTYRFGLVLSEFLLIYTSVSMGIFFNRKNIIPHEIPAYTAVVAFLVQFMVISFVSYLISVSAIYLENKGGKFIKASAVVQIINKLLWGIGTLFSISFGINIICRSMSKISPTVPLMITVGLAVLVHLGITVFMEQKRNFSKSLSLISTASISVILFLAMISISLKSGTPFLFLYAIFLAFISKKTSNKNYSYVSLLVILSEGAYMILFGYIAADNIWINIPYMIAICFSALFLWFVQSNEDKLKYFGYLKIIEYVWIYASLLPINIIQFEENFLPILLSEYAILNLICYITNYGSPNEPKVRKVVKVLSIINIYAGINAFLLQDIFDCFGENVIAIIICVILMTILTAVYVIDFSKSNSTKLQILSAITASAFFAGLAVGFQDEVGICDIYVNSLNMSPFFFVISAVLVYIYMTSKNNLLLKIIFSSMIIDMVMMCSFGYNEIIYATQNTPSQIIAVGFLIAHSALVLGLTFLLSSLTEANNEPSAHFFSKLLSLIWVNFSFPIITACSLNYTPYEKYQEILALIVLTITDALIYIMKYQGERGSKFNKAVKIITSISLYASMITLAESGGKASDLYLLKILLTLTMTALLFVMLIDFLKESSVIIQAYIGLTATIFINCVCVGLSSEYDFTYTFSMLSMLAALACIVSGFVLKAKGLRLYGLIVVMLFVVKLVTVDMSGAESLERVRAFIAGGVICFVISGIYNKVEKKIIESEQKDEINITGGHI